MFHCAKTRNMYTGLCAAIAMSLLQSAGCGVLGSPDAAVASSHERGFEDYDRGVNPLESIPPSGQHTYFTRPIGQAESGPCIDAVGRDEVCWRWGIHRLSRTGHSYSRFSDDGVLLEHNDELLVDVLVVSNKRDAGQTDRLDATAWARISRFGDQLPWVEVELRPGYNTNLRKTNLHVYVDAINKQLRVTQRPCGNQTFVFAFGQPDSESETFHRDTHINMRVAEMTFEVSVFEVNPSGRADDRFGGWQFSAYPRKLSYELNLSHMFLLQDRTRPSSWGCAVDCLTDGRLTTTRGGTYPLADSCSRLCEMGSLGLPKLLPNRTLLAGGEELSFDDLNVPKRSEVDPWCLAAASLMAPPTS